MENAKVILHKFLQFLFLYRHITTTISLSESICQHECSTAAVAAKSLQSCPTLCDPRDGSPRGSPVPGILQASLLSSRLIPICSLIHLMGISYLTCPKPNGFFLPPPLCPSVLVLTNRASFTPCAQAKHTVGSLSPPSHFFTPQQLARPSSKDHITIFTSSALVQAPCLSEHWLPQ